MALAEFYEVKDGHVIFNDFPVKLCKYYTTYCEDQGAEYWDYEVYKVDWYTPDGIELINKIGRGKYSDVFDGVMRRVGSEEEDPVIVKILKPVRKKKIKREISILNHLQGCPNIIEFITAIKDPDSKVMSLVAEKVNTWDFRLLFSTFTATDLKIYLFNLLIALDMANSRGIMHRDIKPHNIMYDKANKKLRLIDWGLAEYYLEGKFYNVRVASRFYKAPELLTYLYVYDYNIDMWSVGCILAALMFKRDPFFKGADNVDQLVKIVEVLGTDEFLKYIKKYGLNTPFDENSKEILNKPRIPWKEFIDSDDQRFLSNDAFDLLDKLLVFDHTERITAKDALYHPYFDEVRVKCIASLWKEYGEIIINTYSDIL